MKHNSLGILHPDNALVAVGSREHQNEVDADVYEEDEVDEYENDWLSSSSSPAKLPRFISRLFLIDDFVDLRGSEELFSFLLENNLDDKRILSLSVSCKITGTLIRWH